MSLARSGHCSIVTKFYHLHAFLSLVNLKIKAIKKHLGAKDNSFHLRASVLCEQRAHRQPRLWHARAAFEWANTYKSMSKYPSWQVTWTMINLYWIYTLEYRCTDQPDIFCFILEHLLFRACTQTALQSFSQMSFVWQYCVIIQGSTLTLH